MAENAYTYLGVALAYPVRLIGGAADVTHTSQETIETALMRLFSTYVGTTFFLPEYGWRGDRLLWNVNDEVTASLAREFAAEAIERWEPRIRFVDAEIKQQDDIMEMQITYKVLSRNEIKTFVFPIYTSLEY